MLRRFLGFPFNNRFNELIVKVTDKDFIYNSDFVYYRNKLGKIRKIKSKYMFIYALTIIDFTPESLLDTVISNESFELDTLGYWISINIKEWVVTICDINVYNNGNIHEYYNCTVSPISIRTGCCFLNILDKWYYLDVRLDLMDVSYLRINDSNTILTLNSNECSCSFEVDYSNNIKLLDGCDFVMDIRDLRFDKDKYPFFEVDFDSLADDAREQVIKYGGSHLLKLMLLY